MQYDGSSTSNELRKGSIDTMVRSHNERKIDNETVRITLERKLLRRISRGRPRKRGIVVVEEDLKTLGIKAGIR